MGVSEGEAEGEAEGAALGVAVGASGTLGASGEGAADGAAVGDGWSKRRVRVTAFTFLALAIVTVTSPDAGEIQLTTVVAVPSVYSLSPQCSAIGAPFAD